MALQILASLKAKSFNADVSSAFGQSVKGQRREAGAEPLFATPPKDGIPGEDDDSLGHCRTAKASRPRHYARLNCVLLTAYHPKQ